MLASCVGLERIREVSVQLMEVRLADLAQFQPLHGSELHALLQTHLYKEGLTKLQMHLRAAHRIALAGGDGKPFRYTARGLKNAKGDREHVKLSDVLGYQFKDPLLERNAQVHSCVVTSLQTKLQMSCLTDVLAPLYVHANLMSGHPPAALRQSLHSLLHSRICQAVHSCP
jgi:hypothetical protein